MSVRPLPRSSSSAKNTVQLKQLGKHKNKTTSTRWILKSSLLCILLGMICVAFRAQSPFPISNGGKVLPSTVVAADDRKDDDSLPSEVQTFLPNACHPHVVRRFPALTSLLERGKGAALGGAGGHWSACTHVQLYGMNFAAFFARHLAYGLRPARVLEFGGGLGTTSDFLARFVPGGSRVVCVEPEAMLGEVFGGAGAPRAFPRGPLQLAMLSFAPEARACADRLFHADMQFELVLSLEVAEHIPAEHASELIERLARATSKYLVFSAARPGQGGTGHIDESMHDRDWWIEQFTTANRGTATGKLKLLPQLSRALRYVTGWAERAYDFGTNLIAFGAPGVEDVAAVPQLAHDCFFHGLGLMPEVHGDDADKAYAREHNMSAFLPLERPCPPPRPEEREKRAAWVEGQGQALWPELDLLVRRVRSGELKCQ
jgi:SAM-dependent methyltransferase